MPYVDLAGLSRFAGKSKDFASSACAGPDMANWQKTPAAGVVSFSPVPEMPLDPAVNFAFTESGPASGTKSPDNPSAITGVTQAKVTRCGKNLITFPYYSQTGTDSHNITWTVNADGSVTASGTTDGISQFHLVKPYWENGGGRLLQAGSYKLSGCASGGGGNTYKVRVLSFSADAGYISAPSDTGSGSTVSITKPIIVSFCIEINNGTTVSNLVFKPQLELGSAATSFEPYEGADYTIDLGGTYYGGSVDLSTGVMTVTHICVELDGSYEFPNNSGGYNSTTGLKFFQGYGPSIFGTAVVNGSSVCSHFVNASCTAAGVEEGTITAPCFALAGTNGSQLRFAAPFSSADGFNGWLANQKTAGTPVLVTAALKNPTIVPLTLQQIYSLSQADPYNPRINTVYSDQTSVQVGYPKSPQATQNELTNAVVSLGGNL